MKYYIMSEQVNIYMCVCVCVCVVNTKCCVADVYCNIVVLVTYSKSLRISSQLSINVIAYILH